MIGRALAGFVAGALVAALIAAMVLRSPGAATAAGPLTPAKGGAAAPRPDDEEAALRKEIAGLEERILSRKSELESLRAAAQAPAARRAATLRAALAKRVGARAKAIATEEFLRTIEGQGLQVDLQRWLAALCDETGLTLAEVTWSPDGLYSFMAEVIASLDPPLPEQAQKDFDAARERIRKEWEEYMRDRSGLSLLRRGLETTEFVNLLYDAIMETIPDERADEVYSSFEYFELSRGDISFSAMWGSRPEVRTKLMNEWATQFELRAEQKAAMGPIVDEFMTRFEALQSRAPTGPGTSYEAGLESRRAEIALQEDMQRRIAAELELTADQAERLNRWSTTYQFEISK